MEFLDEEARPKFQFQSRFTSTSSPEPEPEKINIPVACICVFFSLLLSALTIFFLESETIRFILLWVSLSFCIGPFAPLSVTGGDIRVGQGEVLEPLDPDQTSDDQSKKRVNNRRNKSRKPQEPTPTPQFDSNSTKSEKQTLGLACNGDKAEKDLILEEKEWTDGDFDLLKKQISKHPVGTPKRWELIAEAFKGRHGVDSVIKTAKSMSERKPGGGDSFSQFLKQRKPLDKRMEDGEDGKDGNGEVIANGANGEVKKEGSGAVEGNSWSSTEDIALLSALKAFPKEVPMRWEKISLAIPGRSKTSCMKRVAELKKGFRNSKASAE